VVEHVRIGSGGHRPVADAGRHFDGLGLERRDEHRDRAFRGDVDAGLVDGVVLAPNG
jgi:hypothetical protein